MDILRVDPDDSAQLQALASLHEACRLVDAPFRRRRSAASLADELRYGWDLVPDRGWLLHDDDGAPAYGTVAVTDWDNVEVAWLHVIVHPERRGRGNGRAMASFVEEQAKELGRSILSTDAWEGSAGVQFASQRQYDKKSQAIMRLQDLTRVAETDTRGMRDEALEHASDYELLRLHGAVPEEMLEEYCRVAASINDAPLDDLELEDEDYSPQRMRDHEQALRLRGFEVYRVVARHRRTGELGGHTAMLVERSDRVHGLQEDTAVAPEHRGQRLGVALKTDMMLWLAEVEPQVRSIETWNTETNSHMIAINERLGYEMAGRELQFQKHV